MTLTSISKRLLALASAATLLFAPAMPILAQSAGTGTITGMVPDTTSAVVPKAKAVITDTDTGVARTSPTNGAGTYAPALLHPGHDEGVTSAAGSGTFDRKTLVLTVGQTLTVDAALGVG